MPAYTLRYVQNAFVFSHLNFKWNHDLATYGQMDYWLPSYSSISCYFGAFISIT